MRRTVGVGNQLLHRSLIAASATGQASAGSISIINPFPEHRRQPQDSVEQRRQLSTGEALALVFSPSHLGAQLLETTHAATGLPWWASIPATAIGVRAVLSPLSFRAAKASTNLQLLDASFAQARTLTEGLPHDQAKAMGRLALVRAIYQQLKSRHQAPGFGWYLSNTAVQAAVLLSMTSALNRMSAALWPGLTSEGPPLFKDLTAPPVYLATLSTPYGTLGALLPLALIFVYLRALDASPSARVAGIATAMRVLAAPLYVISLIQPHATLLYWLIHTATSALLQPLLGSKQPTLQAAASRSDGAETNSKAGVSTHISSTDTNTSNTTSSNAAGKAAGLSADPLAGDAILGDVPLLLYLGDKYLLEAQQGAATKVGTLPASNTAPLSNKHSSAAGAAAATVSIDPAVARAVKGEASCLGAAAACFQKALDATDSKPGQPSLQTLQHKSKALMGLALTHAAKSEWSLAMAAAMKLATTESQADELVQQKAGGGGTAPQEQSQQQQGAGSNASQVGHPSETNSSVPGSEHSTGSNHATSGVPLATVGSTPSSTTIHRVNTAHALLWAAEYSLEQAAEIIALGSTRQAEQQEVIVPEGTQESAVVEFLDEADQALKVAEKSLASIGQLQSGPGAEHADKLRDELATLRKRLG